MRYALDYDQHVAAVRRETALLEAALRAGPLDAPVPTCPGWAVTDLADHIGGFTGFWTHVLCDGTGRPKTPAPDMPAGTETTPATVADWFAGLAAHLLAELEATAPDTTIWTWVAEDDTAGFAARRAAHELAIHRVDAQLARGAAAPIDAALAADGIDEVLLMIGNRNASPGGTGQTLHLHGTDDPAVEPHEWLITIGASEVTVTHEHGKGDAAVRGAVSDLELLLYQRPPLGELTTFGDPDVVAAMHRAFTF